MAAPIAIRGPDAAAALFAGLADEAGEVAAIAYLDDGRRLLSLRHIRGTAAGVDVPVRLVAEDALRHHAAAMLVAHNHPSGNPEPSSADLAHTRLLARTLDALGVRMLDALIVTQGGTTSFRERGLL